MDFVARLIAACLLFALFPSAFAVGEISPSTQKTFACNRPSDNARITGTNVVLVGNQCVAGREVFGWGSVSYVVENCDTEPYPATCKIIQLTVFCNGEGPSRTCSTNPERSNAGNISISWSMVSSCGDNATPYEKDGATKCACNANYMQVNGQCQQYTCPPSGGYSAVTQPDQLVSNAGDTVCTGGCGYQPSSWKVGQDGKIWATWPFKSTGSFCKGDKVGSTPVDSGEKNSQNPAPVPCGSNQCPGTVNGATICVPCRGQTDSGSSSAASAPAGSASGAGDTTTTRQTTCDGVNCTTTTTTRDGSGTTVSSTQETKPQESFCRENPESPLCKKSSFGGACAATSCEGDAVQCAIAADQYKRNCQWFDDSRLGAMEEAGNAVMTGTAHPDGHPLNAATEHSVSFSTVIDQTDRLGGSCPQDVSVMVMGKSVSMPLSKACEPLQMVGQLAVAVCMLAAAFIVFKG